MQNPAFQNNPASMMLMTQLIKPKAPEPTQEPEPGSGEEPEVEEFKPLPASDYQEVCNLKNIEDKIECYQKFEDIYTDCNTSGKSFDITDLSSKFQQIKDSLLLMETANDCKLKCDFASNPIEKSMCDASAKEAHDWIVGNGFYRFFFRFFFDFFFRFFFDFFRIFSILFRIF